MLSQLLDARSGEVDTLEQEVFTHPAWHANLLGVESEDLLKGKPALSYILRPGEARFHYYLSFVVESPFTYKHQPFTIAFQDSVRGWGHRNGLMHWTSKLEDLIPLIMHESKERCLPIVDASKRCHL